MTELDHLLRAETAVEAAHNAITAAREAFIALRMGAPFHDVTATLGAIRCRVRQRARDAGMVRP